VKHSFPNPTGRLSLSPGWTRLRVSELIGLKWRCIHSDSITVEQGYFRGDWWVPKTDASAATMGVSPEVIARISVEVRAGRAIRKHKLVKSGGPDDLVFQSVEAGLPMNDQNVLKRHVQPAARRLGLPSVNWRCLRTSHATWLRQAGPTRNRCKVRCVTPAFRPRWKSTLRSYRGRSARALEQLSKFARAGASDSRSNSRSITVPMRRGFSMVTNDC
jgi:integrase